MELADWYQAKLFVEHATGFGMDALHVIIGVVLQFFVALLFRSSVAKPLPLVTVFLLELLNEANDFWVETWPDPAMQFGEAAKDVLLTMLLPIIIFLVARHRPTLLR